MIDTIYMKRNDKLHFISKIVPLKLVSNNNTFLQKLEVGETLNIPVAHHDGNYFIDEAGLEELIKNDQILLRYCNEEAEEINLNGSVSNIAGICNKEKNIFALMPHPERALEEILGSTHGIKMLEGFLNK